MNIGVKKNKKFDLIVWGATGYTGKLVCEYIFKKYKKTNLNWALAGRNKYKIDGLISSLKLKGIPHFVADSNNKKSAGLVHKQADAIRGVHRYSKAEVLWRLPQRNCKSLRVLRRY